MSPELYNDGVSDLHEAAEEEEMLNLEEGVQKMAEKVVEHRTTLPRQLSSTLSTFLLSQRPVFPTRLPDEESGSEAGMVPEPDSGAGANQGSCSSEQIAVLSTEAEKIQLLNQKISSNALMLHVVLKRMEVCTARIDRLNSTNGIISPAFKRKWIS